MRGLARLLDPMRVIVRQPARNPRRTLLTFMGLVISFFLFTMLQSVLATLDKILNNAASAVLVVGARSDGGFGLLVPQLPLSYGPQLRETDGVQAAAALRLFRGFGRDETRPILVLGVEPESFFDVHGDENVSREAIVEMGRDRAGAIVGRRVLEENDWEVGDRVVLGLGRGLALDVNVVGSIPDGTSFGTAFLVNFPYLDSVLGETGRVAVFQVRIDRPEYANSIGRLIDARFANYSVPTETKTLKGYMAAVFNSLGEAFGALRAIGFLTLGVTVLVVANSVSMSVRERTVEIGTLRALGFSKGWILRMIVGESVFVSVLGGLFGAGLAVILVTLFRVADVSLEGGVPLGQLVLDARVFLQVVVLSVPVGALAAAQPVVGAIRMPIANALRFAA